MADASPPDFAVIARTCIAAGESFYVEFKSAFSFSEGRRQPRPPREVFVDISEAVVAFANADGGDLLVGVEDDGMVTGLPYESDILSYLSQAHREGIKESAALDARVHRLQLDGHTILLIRVGAGVDQEFATTSGRILLRRRAASVPASPDEVRRRRFQLRGDRTYESELVPQAQLADLDLTHLKALGRARQPGARLASQRRSAVGQGQQLELFPKPAQELEVLPEVVDLLRYWNLVEQRNGTVILRRAALLLFALEPLRWHANNRIRIRRVHGAEEGAGRTLNTQEVEVLGPIFGALSDAVHMLRREMERESLRNLLFSTTQILPEEAVVEALVNAVVHRNYAIEGQAIEVMQFPDRVEVRSPGRLPEPITVQDLQSLKGVHQARNPIIMRVLRDLGWTRDQGEGMRRMFHSMLQVELSQPDLEEVSGTFIVRLSTLSRYDAATQAWLAAYAPFGLKPEHRRTLVALHQQGGRLSIDKLARLVGETYDDTKTALTALEDLGIVWHRHGHRTYARVEPPFVPHERALHRLAKAGLQVTAEARWELKDLNRLAGTDDPKTALALADQWKSAGLIEPDGRHRWRPGAGLLVYVGQRGMADTSKSLDRRREAPEDE